MRAYVYTDKSLERYAGRFVWLSVNTEDAKNAAFLKRYPIPALPTILVLGTDARVTMRYVGGATVPQLRQMLEGIGRTESESDRLLATADHLASEGNHGAAAKNYDEAIVRASKGWRGLGRAAESLIFSLSMIPDHSRCATRAIELYPRVKGTVSSANVAATGLSCALALEDKQHAATLETMTREVFDDSGISVAADDRSGLYIALIEARDESKDADGALKLRREWAAFLEQAAASAKTPEQRAVYDSHRLTAYLDLGTPEQAIPMLEQSARDFPNDYNPPSRLALAYKAMKEYDKALAASDRALARVNGPRRLTVLSARTDIHVAKGDTASAKKTIDDAIAYAKSLPEGQRSERRIAALEKRLASFQE